MADSLQNIDKKCIFRETFENEQSVRRNGGVPVKMGGGVLPISNGRVTTTGGYITYPNPTTSNSTYSFRIKAKNIQFPAQSTYIILYPFGITITGGTHNITKGNGTSYVNGVASSTLLDVITNDIIISGFSGNNWKEMLLFTYLNKIDPTSSFIADVELVEIYQGTLTADEVKNLYENKRYREVSGHGEQLLISQITTWTAYGNNTSVWDSAEEAQKITYVDNVNGAYHQKGVIIGRDYKLRMLIKTTGALKVRLTNSAVYDIYDSSSSTYVWVNYNFTAAAGTITLTQLLSAGDILYIKETYLDLVQINSTKPILDVCACNGVVKNKYSGDVYGSNLNINNFLNYTPGAFDYDTFIGASPSGVSVTSSSTAYMGTTDEISITNGESYLVEFDLVNTGVTFPAVSIVQALTFVANSNTQTAISGRNKFILTSTLTTVGVVQFFVSGASAYTVSNFSIKKIIPSVINTAVEIVKDNDVWAMKFNGTTSKIDCGSYDGLVGDKTISFWYNIRSKGEFSGGGGCDFISNGKFAILHFTLGLTERWLVTSDAITVTAYTLPLTNIWNKWVHLVVTRAGAGFVNIYMNSINTTASPSLASGIPVAGTTNIILGNDTDSNRTVDGKINNFKIYDGLLTPQEISALYSNEKKLYGL